MNQHYWQRYLKFIKWCDQTQIWLGEKYLERHHIMPKSFGGDDSADNLIKLPYRAHLMAHWMLAKAVPCSETSYALQAMFNLNKNTREGLVNSRAVETCRQIFSKIRSEEMKGKNTPQIEAMHSKNRELGYPQIKKMVEKIKELHNDPEWKAQWLSKQKEAANKPEKLEKISKASKKRWAKEGEKERNAQMMKDRWANDSEYAEKMRKLSNDPDLKAKRAERMRDSEVRKKVSERTQAAMDKIPPQQKRINQLKAQINQNTKRLAQGYNLRKGKKYPISQRKREEILEKISIWKLELENLLKAQENR